jgi:hypothetical protein
MLSERKVFQFPPHKQRRIEKSSSAIKGISVRFAKPNVTYVRPQTFSFHFEPKS